MRSLILLIGLALAGAVHAEPVGGTHTHCWHATGPERWSPPLGEDAEDICCHCGAKAGCIGHGPHKPGCEPHGPALRASDLIYWNGGTTLTPALRPVTP